MKSAVSQHDSGSSPRIYDGNAFSFTAGVPLEKKLFSLSRNAAIALAAINKNTDD